MKSCHVLRLGMIDYQNGLELQESLLEKRRSGAIPDTLLLLEHPSVITLGRHASIKNILVPEETLRREGISVFHTGRGGDVTYHGLGQLVVYPIFSLRENSLNITTFIWRLEEVVIRALLSLGLNGERLPEWRGVFVDREKLCSLGLRISEGVSMHGLALNVNIDLRHFDYIAPCGLSGMKVTSIARLLGHRVEMANVEEIMLAHFSEVFKFSLEADSLDSLGIMHS